MVAYAGCPDSQTQTLQSPPWQLAFSATMGRHMGNTSTKSDTGGRAWLFVLILVAGSGLLAPVRSRPALNRLSADPDAYRLIAENLVQRGVFSRSTADVPAIPTVFRPPLYPLLLAAISWNGQVRPLGVATVHVLTGMLTVGVVYLLGRRWGLQAWSYLAAVGVAVDPILLYQAGEVMTETLRHVVCRGGVAGTDSLG